MQDPRETGELAGRLAAMPLLARSARREEPAWDGEHLELLLASAQREEELERRGCVLVRSPCERTKYAGWKNVVFQNPTGHVDIFVGQLIANSTPTAIATLLQHLVGAPRPIVGRLKRGPRPTCAFASIPPESRNALLALSKRALCDPLGAWVAPPGDAEAMAAIEEECDRRTALYLDGLPRSPMVFEDVLPGKLGSLPHPQERGKPHHESQARPGTRAGKPALVVQPHPERWINVGSSIPRPAGPGMNPRAAPWRAPGTNPLASPWTPPKNQW